MRPGFVPVTTYLDDAGREITREAFYERMVEVAQERQRAFPWWASARRRWKRSEREYRLKARGLA